MGHPVISLEDVTKTYLLGDVEVPVLKNVNVEVERGEYVALMGPSGSGKSTLMNLIGLLDEPTSGNYLLDGTPAASLGDVERARLRNATIGFIFQTFNLLPHLDALANVELPLRYAGIRDAGPRARALLERVGMADRLDHRPAQLSGGQRQRVAIARSLVNDPALILADEPTGNLDSHTGAETLDLLDELHAQGRTILIVTHDEQVAARAQRTIRLFDGVIVEDGAPHGVGALTASAPLLHAG
ncbi:MAG: ABC transporter ATP-binding protein [Coriobacteriia bacterium]|nr:ABC transporter ATP-binding protein [Coriobacteriia bacterium]